MRYPSDYVFSFLLYLSLSLTPATATAMHILIQIPSSNTLSNPSILPPSTTATLTTCKHIHTSPLDTHNRFSFRNVTAGSYLIDVHCPLYSFAPLRIDVGTEKVEAWGTFRGNEWENKGEVVPVLVSEGTSGSGEKVVTVEVAVVGGGKNYFTERSGFSPLSLLKNPMILLGGFSMLVVFGMPYLMDSMDPETRAEFEERQKSSSVSGLLAGQQPGQNPLANFDAAAWLAGSGGKEGGAGSQERGVTR